RGQRLYLRQPRHRPEHHRLEHDLARRGPEYNRLAHGLARCGQWLALTLGPRGAVMLARAGQGWQAWHARELAPVVVADTVGAGDCFLAGLVAALLERPAMRQAHDAHEPPLQADDIVALLRRAVASASLCVMQAGCVPPTRTAVLERILQAGALVQPLQTLKLPAGLPHDVLQPNH
ncbi:MAG: carbohydrate kinase family protein, partial [Pseudomonadota bacterium]